MTVGRIRIRKLRTAKKVGDRLYNGVTMWLGRYEDMKLLLILLLLWDRWCAVICLAWINCISFSSLLWIWETDRAICYWILTTYWQSSCVNVVREWSFCVNVWYCLEENKGCVMGGSDALVASGKTSFFFSLRKKLIFCWLMFWVPWFVFWSWRWW